MTADISTIDAAVVQESTRGNDINTLIKGQATGVVVRQSNGAVGTGSDVRIRGTGSLSLSNQTFLISRCAFYTGVCSLHTKQLNSPDSIIITRNNMVDKIWVAV